MIKRGKSKKKSRYSKSLIKIRKIYLLFLLFLIVLLLLRFKNRADINQQEQMQNKKQQSEEQIDIQFPVDYKIASLLVYPINLNNTQETIQKEVEFVLKNNIGFIILYGTNLSKQQVSSFTEKLSTFKIENLEPVKIPFVMVDHEGGTVQRLNGDGFTKLPSMNKLCLSFNDNKSKIKQMFDNSASELKDAGIDIVLAPVVDIAYPKSFLKTRACSNKKEIEDVASLYILSFGQKGILPVIKHFPGIGNVDKDLHKVFSFVDFDETQGYVFFDLLMKFPNIGVMTSHVGVNNITDVSCSMDRKCIENLALKYPNVLIFTDDILMKGVKIKQTQDIKELNDLAQRIEQAIVAGNDVIIMGNKDSYGKNFQKNLEQAIKELEQFYEQDPTFRSRVNSSFSKVRNLSF